MGPHAASLALVRIPTGFACSHAPLAAARRCLSAHPSTHLSIRLSARSATRRRSRRKTRSRGRRRKSTTRTTCASRPAARPAPAPPRRRPRRRGRGSTAPLARSRACGDARRARWLGGRVFARHAALLTPGRRARRPLRSAPAAAGRTMAPAASPCQVARPFPVSWPCASMNTARPPAHTSWRHCAVMHGVPASLPTRGQSHLEPRAAAGSRPALARMRWPPARAQRRRESPPPIDVAPAPLAPHPLRARWRARACTIHHCAAPYGQPPHVPCPPRLRVPFACPPLRVSRQQPH